MITARTRSETMLLRAAEALAKELAKPDKDWRVILDIAIAQAHDEMPPMPKVTTRTKVYTQGVNPEDL